MEAQQALILRHTTIAQRVFESAEFDADKGAHLDAVLMLDIAMKELVQNLPEHLEEANVKTLLSKIKQRRK